MKLIIMGKPIAKKRPRFVRKTGRAYDDQASESGRFLLTVREQINAKQVEGFFIAGKPLIASFFFYFEVPKSYPKRMHKAVESGQLIPHTKKPDLSNLVKFAEDILNNELWKDDSQIAESFCSKYYALKARTEIILTEWKGVEK